MYMYIHHHVLLSFPIIISCRDPMRVKPPVTNRQSVIEMIINHFSTDCKVLTHIPARYFDHKKQEDKNMVTLRRVLTDLDRAELQFHRQYVAELLANNKAVSCDSNNQNKNN